MWALLCPNLSLGKLSALIFAPWGTILAAWEHLGVQGNSGKTSWVLECDLYQYLLHCGTPFCDCIICRLFPGPFFMMFWSETCSLDLEKQTLADVKILSTSMSFFDIVLWPSDDFSTIHQFNNVSRGQNNNISARSS